MSISIYPNYILIFLVFNLLGWWFKGHIFFSWWYFIPIAVITIVIDILAITIAKQILQLKGEC